MLKNPVDKFSDDAKGSACPSQSVPKIGIMGVWIDFFESVTVTVLNYGGVVVIDDGYMESKMSVLVMHFMTARWRDEIK